MTNVLSDITVMVNNQPIGIVPNTASYTEGLGEQNVRVASTGGGATQIITSSDVEMNLSDPKFSIYPTKANIEEARTWKVNGSNNVIAFVDQESGFSRTFTNAILVSNYEVAIGSDTTVPLEFKSSPAV